MLGKAGDQASLSYGGINFDSALLNLQIERDDKGAPLPMDSQAMVSIESRIEGFFPLIVDIHPFVPVIINN